MKRILIINGPNLNLLGTRQPKIYGNRTFEIVLGELRTAYSDLHLDYFQSNMEDELIDSMIKPYASFLLYENYQIDKLAFAE